VERQHLPRVVLVALEVLTPDTGSSPQGSTQQEQSTAPWHQLTGPQNHELSISCRRDGWYQATTFSPQPHRGQPLTLVVRSCCVSDSAAPEYVRYTVVAPDGDVHTRPFACYSRDSCSHAINSDRLLTRADRSLQRGLTGDGTEVDFGDPVIVGRPWLSHVTP
jgi:hypothetical protein